MGIYDGAEICELVGLFLLNMLKERFENIGLHRDDGLAAIKTTPGRLADKARTQLIEIFNKFGDVTLDGTYKPYRKPNGEPLYIKRLSNHPPAVVNQLP